MSASNSSNPQRLARMEYLLNQLIKKNDALHDMHNKLCVIQRVAMVATLMSCAGTGFSMLYNSQTSEKKAPTENCAKATLGLVAALFVTSQIKYAVRQKMYLNTEREQEVQFRLNYHKRKNERSR